MPEPRGTSCGDWKIEDRLIVDNDGVAKATWITDGHSEMITTASAAQLMVGLAMHLEVDHFEQEET